MADQPDAPSSRPNRQSSFEGLWTFGVATAAAALGTLVAQHVPAPVESAVLGWVGGGCLLAALTAPKRLRILLLIAAGLGLGGWRGGAEAHRLRALETLMEDPSPTAPRVTMAILEGWSETRWGRSTVVRVIDATHRDRSVALPRRCRLEVRGPSNPADLPEPGRRLSALVRLKGEARRPLLVVASAALLNTAPGRDWIPEIRGRLSAALTRAAGLNVARLRAADLASALALGRRDRIPDHRRRGWRASGLGHALAVSGLHVGIVAGTLWLITIVAGCRPRAARWIMLVVTPLYTLLAGAAPSAVRACTMLCIYLIARLIGRAAAPLGTVLAAGAAMILVAPALLLHVGFQLTVAVSAALIRWSPSVMERLRGPLWFRGLVAVPVVAQLAAAPILAAHFHTVVPLSVLVNLAVPVLLTPIIVLSVAATALSAVWAGAAGLLLGAVGLLAEVLWWIGGLGRQWNPTVGTPPAVAAAALCLAGLAAVRLDRIGRWGAGLWIILLVGLPFMRSGFGSAGTAIELLPVGDGLAVTITADGHRLLFDGGRFDRQAAELLADGGGPAPDAVVASHGDADHIGGLPAVVRSSGAGRVVIPDWLFDQPSVVPLLRTARSGGAAVIRVARGTVLTIGPSRLDVLWPPADVTGSSNNDRSMIVRARLPSGTAIVAGDIGSGVERAVARSTDVGADVLVAAHHGSASSTSPEWLRSVSPDFVLIPAAPANRHHHPHHTVLDRLRRLSIPFVFPARDGRCGVRWKPDGSAALYNEPAGLR